MQVFKVYVKINLQGNITAVNSSGFLDDLTGWLYIDEGIGDNFHHAQSNYFEKPLYEEHGIPVYKLVNGMAVERTAEEIAEDISNIPAPVSEPTVWDELDGAYTAGYESGYAEGVNSI